MHPQGVFAKVYTPLDSAKCMPGKGCTVPTQNINKLFVLVKCFLQLPLYKLKLE